MVSDVTVSRLSRTSHSLCAALQTRFRGAKDFASRLHVGLTGGYCMMRMCGDGISIERTNTYEVWMSTTHVSQIYAIVVFLTGLISCAKDDVKIEHVGGHVDADVDGEVYVDEG
jgi:hypothetical protein